MSEVALSKTDMENLVEICDCSESVLDDVKKAYAITYILDAGLRFFDIVDRSPKDGIINEIIDAISDYSDSAKDNANSVYNYLSTLLKREGYISET